MMSGPLLAPSPPPSAPHTTVTTTTATTTTNNTTTTIPPQQDPPPPSSQVIPILPTELARIYSLTHPLVVLSLYYFAFPSIVANPVLALQYLLVPLSVLQLAYVVTCLPATTSASASGNGSGSLLSSSSSSSSPFFSTGNLHPIASKKPSALSKHKGKGKGKGKKAQGNGFGLSGKIVAALLSHLLTILLAAPVCTILLILFGGPLTTHFLHNILCASHMSLLAVLPLFYVYGVDAEVWNEIISASLPFDEVWGGTVGTVLGAWFGAVPIPLDWDREWQKWPITIVTGAYLGWGIGRFAGGYLFRGKRIKFD